MDIQTLAVILSLHVFKANFYVWFESGANFAESRHSSQPTELVGRY
jgi:hypothetical protein